jgi:hypothetical protein
MHPVSPVGTELIKELLEPISTTSPATSRNYSKTPDSIERTPVVSAVHKRTESNLQTNIVANSDYVQGTERITLTLQASELFESLEQSDKTSRMLAQIQSETAYGIKTNPFSAKM